MRKFTKRLSALILAATMIASTAISGYAASSPIKGNEEGTVIVNVEKTSQDDEIKVTSAKTTSSSQKNLYVKGWLNNKYVKVISTGAVSDKKYDKITLELWNRTKIQKNVLKGKAKKTKTVVITKTEKANKLVAKRFNKAAFKGFKGKIIVKKSAMTKKQYKKLKKKLKKGGFKGKISYKK